MGPNRVAAPADDSGSLTISDVVLPMSDAGHASGAGITSVTTSDGPSTDTTTQPGRLDGPGEPQSTLEAGPVVLTPPGLPTSDAARVEPAVDGQVGCSTRTRWSQAEWSLLALSDGTAHDADGLAWCELEAGHDGPHYALARIIGPDCWWLSWTGATGGGAGEHRCVAHLGFCGNVQRDGAECSLPIGHDGVHSPRLHQD